MWHVKIAAFMTTAEELVTVAVIRVSFVLGLGWFICSSVPNFLGFLWSLCAAKEISPSGGPGYLYIMW